jgi:hypothetical protein
MSTIHNAGPGVEDSDVPGEEEETTIEHSDEPGSAPALRPNPSNDPNPRIKNT